MRRTVTIVISARNRPDELAHTLRLLRLQSYAPLEVIVIDDASEISLAGVVAGNYPQARFLRSDTRLNLIRARNVASNLSTGTYFVLLDDDSCFTRPDDLERAVTRMDAEASLGVLTFRVHHGADIPSETGDPGVERYLSTYTGCASMLRKAAVDQVGPFQAMLEYYGEEIEHSRRLINGNWRILYYPEVIVHHRKSAIGRSEGRIWAYTARNDVWSVFLNMPWLVVAPELAWKLFVHLIEAVRRFEVRWALWMAASTLRGLPRVLKARQAVSWKAYRQLTALRFRDLQTAEEYERASLPRFGELIQWLTSRWWHRRRARSFWDRSQGGRGRSEFATYSDHA